MTSQTREQVALVAGRLIIGESAADVAQKGQKMNHDLQGLKLSRYVGDAGCGSKHGPDGSNYCLIDEKSGQHICLSLYGKVFDGYDFASSSHFGGFVVRNTVSLYDYQEAYYFDYQL